MNKIQIKILNPENIQDCRKMMALGARLTQHGHEIHDIDDFMKLYNKTAGDNFIYNLTALPHPTLQKLGTINIVVVGASRRFLAQITRHQNEVKFISASLQYSDYGGQADFVVPYEILNTEQEPKYLEACMDAMRAYKNITKDYDHDSAGYAAPQGLRNILAISATPYQWKHMISQRVCRRNTDETRYVMLKIWQALFELAPEMFTLETTGPFCMQDKCLEGKMACGHVIGRLAPREILHTDFSKLYQEETT